MKSKDRKRIIRQFGFFISAKTPKMSAKTPKKTIQKTIIAVTIVTFLVSPFTVIWAEDYPTGQLNQRLTGYSPSQFDQRTSDAQRVVDNKNEGIIYHPAQIIEHPAETITESILPQWSAPYQTPDGLWAADAILGDGSRIAAFGGFRNLSDLTATLAANPNQRYSFWAVNVTRVVKPAYAEIISPAWTEIIVPVPTAAPIPASTPTPESAPAPTPALTPTPVAPTPEPAAVEPASTPTIQVANQQPATPQVFTEAAVLPAAISSPETATVFRVELTPAKPISSKTLAIAASQSSVPMGLIDSLINLLKNGDYNSKQHAAEELGTIKDPRVIAALVSLLKEADNGTRMYVVEAFRNLGAFGVDGLIDTLENGDSIDKANAIWVLGKLGKISDDYDSVIVDALIKTLKDKDQNIRYTSAQALGDMGDTRSVTALKEALLTDPYYIVRAQAAEALGKINSPLVLEALIEGLQDENPFVIEKVAEALGSIGEPAIDKLKEALASKNLDAARGALKALGMIGGTHTAEVLKNVMADGTADASLRQEAASAFAKILITRTNYHLSTEEADFLIKFLGDKSLQDTVKNIFLRNGDTKLSVYLLTAYFSGKINIAERNVVGEIVLGLFEKEEILSQVKQRYGIVIDDRLPLNTLNTVLSVLNAIPADLKGLREIRWDPQLIATGNYDASNKTIYIGEQSGLGDLFHEIFHFIDDARFNTDAFGQLYAASDKSPQSGFIDFAREYGAKDKFEDFATVGEFYTRDTKTEFLRAINQAENNKPIYLAKILFVVDFVTVGGYSGDHTVLFQGNTEGRIVTRDVSATRDESGMVVTLGGVNIYNPDGSYNFTVLKNFFNNI